MLITLVLNDTAINPVVRAVTRHYDKASPEKDLQDIDGLEFDFNVTGLSLRAQRMQKNQ